MQQLSEAKFKWFREKTKLSALSALLTYTFNKQFRKLKFKGTHYGYVSLFVPQSAKHKMISLNIYVDFLFSDTQFSPFSLPSIPREKKTVKCLLKQTNKQTKTRMKGPTDLQVHYCILLLCYFISRKSNCNYKDTNIYYSVAQEAKKSHPLCSCQNMLSLFLIRTLEAGEQQSQLQHPAASCFFSWLLSSINRFPCSASGARKGILPRCLNSRRYEADTAVIVIDSFGDQNTRCMEEHLEGI